MDNSDLEARLARLERRVDEAPPTGFGGGVERSMNAFAKNQSAANARALLDEIDRAEPNPDEGVMSGTTITVTITITITVKMKAVDEPDGPETDPETPE